MGKGAETAVENLPRAEQEGGRDARRYIGTFVLSETPATTLELSPGRDVRRYIGPFALSETSAAALYFVLLWRSETLVSVLRE